MQKKKAPSTFGGNRKSNSRGGLRGVSQLAKGSPTKGFAGPGVKLSLSPKPGLRGSGRVKRVAELKKLITLSEDSFEVFSQPPLAPIDVYVRWARPCGGLWSPSHPRGSGRTGSQVHEERAERGCASGAGADERRRTDGAHTDGQDRVHLHVRAPIAVAFLSSAWCVAAARIPASD